MIYLIHFDKPLKHAKHYIGFAEDDIEKRIKEHKSGQGAKILRALKQNGIDFNVVLSIKGDRNFERRMKNRKKADGFCPVCNPKSYKKVIRTLRDKHSILPPPSEGKWPKKENSEVQSMQ